MRWCNKAYMFYYHHFNPQFNPQFNPRTHMGCDNVGTFSSSDDGFISIHAPTWGATRLDKRGSSSDKFQSTHPHGVRPADSVGISALTRFQSTHPHGVRLSQRTPNARPRGIFQSTHPHGVRPSWSYVMRPSLRISIHAPTWGATCGGRGRRRALLLISIHAPTWGATSVAIS